MSVLAETGRKTIVALRVDADCVFASPFSGDSFPCMIWDHDGRFTEAQRGEVARRLLESGCRYVVCGGQNCDAWHSTVDEEFVRQHLEDPEDTLDDVLVMTTAHTGESPDDVAFFFVANTNFGDHRFERYLVLHIGDSRAREEVDAAVRRYALDERPV